MDGAVRNSTRLDAAGASLLYTLRDYLDGTHPLSRTLQPARDWVEADHGRAGRVYEAVAPNVVVRAGDGPTAQMEIALIYDRAAPPAHAVVFSATGDDAARHGISPHTALYERLLYPIIFETGTGGWFRPYTDDDGRHEVVSTTGVRLTLFDYVGCMMYQNRRGSP